MVKQYNLDPEKFKNHPAEDYFWISKKYPIFVVADGVTLELDKEGNYPNPSGAHEISKIFCHALVQEAERVYEDFSENNIKDIFSYANKKAGEYNFSQNHTKQNSNFWDFDLFAATSAFVIIKDDTIYWGSICDSHVMAFKKDSSLVFESPDCWPNLRKNLPLDWKEKPENIRKKAIRSIYRNGLNENGETIGYGVITGEESANRYLKSGKFTIDRDDLVTIFTDGFEDYFKIPEFVSMLRLPEKDLEEKLKLFTQSKTEEDPNKFGHEKTLIRVII